MRVSALPFVCALAAGCHRPPPEPPTDAGPPAVSSAKPLEWNSVPVEALPAAGELPPDTLRVLVLGDSVAKFLGNVMRFRQSTARAFVAQRGVGTCSIRPADDGSSCATAWEGDVAELHPDVTFVILGGGFLGPQTCEREWRRSYHDRLRTLLREIAPNAGRIVLALVPYASPRWRTTSNAESVLCFDDELASVGSELGASMLDLLHHVCPHGDVCNETSEGAPIRRDGLHFDGPGAHETAEWTLRELRRIAGR